MTVQSMEKYAYGVVHRALAMGNLKRPEKCSKCDSKGVKSKDGRATIHAHHEDHSRPLDVEWLCAKCHIGITKRHRGVDAPANKLSEAQVKAVYTSNLSNAALGRKYGVNASTISRIRSGENWGWLKSAWEKQNNG